MSKRLPTLLVEDMVGATANRLPNEYCLANSQIEWERIIGLRNRLIHNYFGTDYSILWKIIKVYLPQLVKQLMKLK